MNRFFAVAALCCTIAGPGLANSIAGQASVIDGDTIEIHGERIRLVSIDAPESRQPCFDHQSRAWLCYNLGHRDARDIGVSPASCAACP